jgi:hypothetical protein
MTNDTEHTLILQITTTWPAETQARFDLLVARREAGVITPPELHELIALTDAAEQRNVERLKALMALAHIRQTTVPALLEALQESEQESG